MILNNFINNIKSLFFKGFIFLLPITITFGLFSFVFGLIHHWLAPIRRLPLPIIQDIPYYEIWLVIAFIMLIGFLLKTTIFRFFLHVTEDIFSKLPGIRLVYPAIKHLISAFTSQNKNSVNMVVLVEFPQKNTYSIGFLTKDVSPSLLNQNETAYVNIYIPMAPNPTHGFFIMVPKGNYIETDLTRQEATSLIISGGILEPNRYKTK